MTAPSRTPLPWHRPLIALTAVTGLLTLVALGGLVVDDREVVGSAVWLKPFKFAVSFSLYGLTIAWLLRYSTRARRTGWWAGTVVAVTSAVEIALIVLQAARGVPSHYNNATQFDVAVWAVMGNTVVVLWAASAVVAGVVAAQRGIDPVLRSAVRFGFPLSLAGMLLAFMMTAQVTPEQQAELDRGGTPAMVGAHSVGVADGGPAMPVTGWSTTGGDLRVPHFVGIHALQALPLLALALAAFARRSPAGRVADVRTRAGLVRVAAFGYAGLVALLTWQALREQALLRPDRWTLLAGFALASVVAAGLAVALRRRATPVLVVDNQLASANVLGT